MLRDCAIVSLLIVAAVSARADRVFWGCAYKGPQTLRAGEITCQQEIRECRKMSLTCVRGAKPLFKVDDFADAIAASDDGQYIVGLSNRGMVNLYWIRRANGDLIKYKTDTIGTHYWPSVHYCEESVTNVRVWFDAHHPDVRIQTKDGKLLRVVVEGCDGKELELY